MVPLPSLFLEVLNLRKLALTLVLLTIVSLAYPWQKQGFTAIYSYSSKSYGLLALKVKGSKGTMAFTFINITDGTIHYKVLMNITVFLGNKLHKTITNEMTLKVPINASTIFITNETLKGMKKTGSLSCKGYTCIYSATKEFKVQKSIILVTKVKEVIDLKTMLAKEVMTRAYLKTAKGLVLGRSIAVMKLVKTSP